MLIERTVNYQRQIDITNRTKVPQRSQASYSLPRLQSIATELNLTPGKKQIQLSLVAGQTF